MVGSVSLYDSGIIDVNYGSASLRLFSARDSLWADWIRNNKIKDSVFWSIDEKKTTSWTWKSLLHLRPLARRFIRCNVGSGIKASFWFDWWTPFGPLIDFLGDSEPAQTGIPLKGSVANACSMTGWRLRPARSPQAELLHFHLTTLHLPASSIVDDSYFWRIEDIDLEAFSTKKTWEAIRHRQQPLSWASQVWYKGAIPRHTFMMWIVFLNMIPTRTRLASWGMQIDTTCCICGIHSETRDHLFLHCEFSEDLWVEATRRLGYRSFVFHTWEAFSAWLDIKDSTSTQTVRRLVSQTVIYTIWTERNNRYHNNVITPVHVLFKKLDRQVRDAILAKRHQRKFNHLMQSWLRFI
ncbi:PREDICTED: uncharacterized protein LOC109130228 [Camelina sativa]|uniref:Uncharacterized protein LOC109130228 n=1 Tax=Camelina sativa TaxID=90675 RepID=A0ABM1R834_CAMSA|nr:PREDICTED: uncharacterized protein LOC109130228 [Camelina sativa]